MCRRIVITVCVIRQHVCQSSSNVDAKLPGNQTQSLNKQRAHKKFTMDTTDSEGEDNPALAPIPPMKKQRKRKKTCWLNRKKVKANKTLLGDGIWFIDNAIKKKEGKETRKPLRLRLRLPKDHPEQTKTTFSSKR